jgi:Excreted virulence factor EspC, type VII ESX diderm
MADQSIRITPDVLRQIAAHHDGIADELAAARSAGEGTLDAVATHGPIMHTFKDAVADAVARRDAAFAAHEADHRAAADKLRDAAARFDVQEDINAARLQF